MPSQPPPPLLPSPTRTHPSPSHTPPQTPLTPRTRALQAASAELDLPPGLNLSLSLGLGITPPSTIYSSVPNSSAGRAGRGRAGGGGDEEGRSRNTSESYAPSAAAAAAAGGAGTGYPYAYPYHGYGYGAGPGYESSQAHSRNTSASYPSSSRPSHEQPRPQLGQLGQLGQLESQSQSNGWDLGPVQTYSYYADTAEGGSGGTGTRSSAASAYPSWLPQRPAGPLPEGWASGTASATVESVLQAPAEILPAPGPSSRSSHSQSGGSHSQGPARRNGHAYSGSDSFAPSLAASASPSEDPRAADLLPPHPQPQAYPQSLASTQQGAGNSKRSSATQRPPPPNPKPARMGEGGWMMKLPPGAGYARGPTALASFSWASGTSDTVMPPPPSHLQPSSSGPALGGKGKAPALAQVQGEEGRERRASQDERQATPRRVVVRAPVPPPAARTSQERQRGISFDSAVHPALTDPRRGSQRTSATAGQQGSFGRQTAQEYRTGRSSAAHFGHRYSSSGSQPGYLQPPSPSGSASTEGSTALLQPRPIPTYKHPLFRPSLLLDPTWTAKLHYRLLPLFAFYHLPLQVYLDINALYILVLCARFPAPPAPGVPGDGKPWALATAAYALCVFLQLVVVFLVYEVLYSFYRRWRVSRPPITPIYLSRPASTFVAMFSFAHFSFLNQVRRSAWRSRSPRAPGGWRDGLAEQCYLYAQNGWTVATLLPRAALALALLLAFWLPPRGGPVFGPTGVEDAKDGLFFDPAGGLTTYAKCVLAINAGWTAWRTLVLLLSWLGLWILSGLACAGLCGPRNRWEESRYFSGAGTEKDALAAYAWAGERELDALAWGWRERTRERVREAWEFCLADRYGRRFSAASASANGTAGPAPPGGVEEARRREGPRMSLEDPSPEPEVVEREKRSSEMSRIMQNFLAVPLAPPPSSVPGTTTATASAVQSPQALLGGTAFAEPGNGTGSGSGPSSGGHTGTHVSPALASGPFFHSQTRQEMRNLPSRGRPRQGKLVQAPSRQSLAVDLGETELAARVQQILSDWVDPDEDDALAQALLGTAPRAQKPRASTEEHEREMSRDEQRKREREAIAGSQGVLVPIEVANPGASDTRAKSEEPEDEGAGERRSYPPEEGRSASMSSLGQPLQPGQSAFERFRPGSRTQSAASGSAAPPGMSPRSHGHSRGNSQSVSGATISPVSMGHAYTDSTGSQALSDPGVPMLATRFNPSLPHLAPLPQAHHPPSQSSKRQAAPASSGESSPTSVAGVFVGRPIVANAIETEPEPELMREQEGQEHDTGAEGDEEEVSPEERDSIGGPSRATTVGRLIRSRRSLAGSASSASNSASERSRAEPELQSSSSGLPNRQHRASEAEVSYYSDARSQAQSAHSSPQDSGESPSEDDEEPIVDRTFGRQSDWTSQLEAEDAPRSVRSSASTRPTIMPASRRQASAEQGSPNLTIRRSLPPGSLASTVPAPIPIRSPPSAQLRPQPSGDTISAGSNHPVVSSSANDSFVTAPMMETDSDPPPPLPTRGAWTGK